MKIEQLHDLYYEMLLVIDQICRENQLSYFLSSGTLLGAIRHQDFIPWDDDVDLEMLLEDYPVFRRAMLEHLPPHYHLIEPQDFAPGFFDLTVRIIRDDVPLRKPSAENEYYHNYQNRLCIDIFFLTKLPNSVWGEKWRVLEYRVLNGLLMSRRYCLHYEEHTPLERCQMFLLSHIGRLFSMRSLYRIYHWINHRMDGKAAVQRIYCNGLVAELHRHYQNSWYQESAEARIREHSFPVPADWDAVLTKMYGDYMTPPAQKSNERMHVDLER